MHLKVCFSKTLIEKNFRDNDKMIKRDIISFIRYYQLLCNSMAETCRIEIRAKGKK